MPYQSSRRGNLEDIYVDGLEECWTSVYKSPCLIARKIVNISSQSSEGPVIHLRRVVSVEGYLLVRATSCEDAKVMERFKNGRQSRPEVMLKRIVRQYREVPVAPNYQESTGECF